jgi:hypothetical protein
MHGPLNPRRREAFDVRYHYLLVFGRSLNDHLSFLGSVLLDVGLSGGANDLDDQVGEADAIELLWEVAVSRVVLSRQLRFLLMRLYWLTGWFSRKKLMSSRPLMILSALSVGRTPRWRCRIAGCSPSCPSTNTEPEMEPVCQLRRATILDAQLTL